MSDAMLTAGAPVCAGAGDRPSGPERAERADSSYELLRDPAAPGRRPGLRLAWFRAMTQAPARLRAETDGRPGPATQDPALDGLLPSSRWRRYGWVFAAIWLVYLSQPASTAWGQHDPVRRYLGLATMIAFAAVFVATFALSRRRADRQVPRAFAAAALSAEAALIGFGYYSIGADASVLFIYLSVMAVFLLPARTGWAVVVVAVAASLAVPAIRGWHPDGTLAFQIFVSALAAFGVVQLIQRNMQLAAARNELTRLALADERNRFARDLHDILGHSLTVVAVKAELAGRLAGLDPVRAEAEIADVERIARQALADVRAAAAGYREITLCGELASARTALSAAGIEADLPDGEISGIPRLHQELFGWAVREGVTNVIRHSQATRCVVRVTPDEVEISDDGIGPGERPPATPRSPLRAEAPGGAVPAGQAAEGGFQHPCPGQPSAGHGLSGLRERAAAAGAVVSVGRSALGGFALRVRMP
jgi:two-component system, NarL family, sensor histidine kinase DesK